MPVYNGLTDEWHPTQILADFLTLREHIAKPLAEISFCYLGDARFNMADSYLVGGAKLGMDIRIASPSDALAARRRSSTSRARSPRTPAPPSRSPRASRTPCRGCDAIATDVWLSMGEPEEAWAERISLLTALPGQRGRARAHRQPRRQVPALPAGVPQRRHGRGQDILERFGLDALEVTDDVFESPASVVFDEAENRMHTIKAVLVATLADSRYQ